MRKIWMKGGREKEEKRRVNHWKGDIQEHTVVKETVQINNHR